MKNELSVNPMVTPVDERENEDREKGSLLCFAVWLLLKFADERPQNMLKRMGQIVLNLPMGDRKIC